MKQPRIADGTKQDARQKLLAIRHAGLWEGMKRRNRALVYSVAEVFPEYIGKERARKLAEALHCDYRQLL